MWAVDKDGKQLMRIDGRVWDGKTMREVSSKLSAQTTIYKQINVVNMDKEHKGLITFNELHPGWRSSLMTALASSSWQSSSQRPLPCPNEIARHHST